MMKHNLLGIILTFLLFSLPAYSFALKKYEVRANSLSTVKGIFERFSEKKLNRILNKFIEKSSPARMVGHQGHTNAILHIINTIKKIDSGENSILYIDEFSPDVNAAIHSYQEDLKKHTGGKSSQKNKSSEGFKKLTDNIIRVLTRFKGQKGKNIIWEKRGSTNPEEVLILGAHYDTIVFDKVKNSLDPLTNMPGADNNGTGVSILLGLIELLSDMKIKRTVRIVFFDFEELGNLGTRAYATKYAAEIKKSSGFVNFLMLGHDTEGQDQQKTYNNMRLYIRKKTEKGHNKDLTLANSLVNVGKKIWPSVSFEVVPNSFKFSGHKNFWDLNIPVLVFSQNWEDDFNGEGYQTSKDSYETLNLETFYNSFVYTAGSIVGWALGLEENGD